MKNLICLIGQLGNGGSEKQLYLFLKYLNRTHYNPIVVVSSSDEGKWRKMIESLSITVISLWGLKHIFKLLKFRYLVFKYKPEIIISWSFFTNAFCIFAGCEDFVGGLRGDLYAAKERLHPLHWKKSLVPENFIVNSSLLREELLKEKIAEDKIHVIYNIYERNSNFSEKIYLDKYRGELRKKLNIPENSLVVASIARNTPEKDIPFFINAFQKASEKAPDMKALLIGSGGTAFEEEIKKRGLSGKFVLTGHYENAPELLPAADIYFLSSKSEGMPNVVLEALDAGCCVLSTDVGGVRDIFQELDEKTLNDIIIRNGDIETASEKLLNLAWNADLRKSIARQSEKCLDKFSPQNITLKYQAVIERKTDF